MHRVGFLKRVGDLYSFKVCSSIDFNFRRLCQTTMLKVDDLCIGVIQPTMNLTEVRPIAKVRCHGSFQSDDSLFSIQANPLLDLLHTPDTYVWLITSGNFYPEWFMLGDREGNLLTMPDESDVAAIIPALKSLQGV